MASGTWYDVEIDGMYISCPNSKVDSVKKERCFSVCHVFAFILKCIVFIRCFTSGDLQCGWVLLACLIAHVSPGCLTTQYFNFYPYTS